MAAKSRDATGRSVKLLHLLERTLLVAGAGLLLIYFAAQTHAARGRQGALDAFNVAQAQFAGDSEMAVVSEPDQSLWSDTRKEAYQASQASAAGAPVGVLKIPSVDLEVPVFDGTGELNLNRGAGWIEGTPSLGSRGNVGIAGHRDGFFRVLREVEVGDVMLVETLSGSTRYRVSELMIVEPTDVYVLEDAGHHALTLVTCYPFYFVGHAPQRFIVRGVLDTSTDASQT
jgi:sortase A